MKIELLDGNGNIITTIVGVKNPEKEFKEYYGDVYNAASWREIFPMEPEPPSIDQLKTFAWSRIKSIRDRIEQSGVSYMGKTLDSDSISAQRISNAVQAAQSAIMTGIDFTLSWKMQDNTVLTLNAQQVLGMSVALAQYSNELHEIAQGLKERVDAAQSAAELDAIVWPEG